MNKIQLYIQVKVVFPSLVLLRRPILIGILICIRHACKCRTSYIKEYAICVLYYLSKVRILFISIAALESHCAGSCIIVIKTIGQFEVCFKILTNTVALMACQLSDATHCGCWSSQTPQCDYQLSNATIVWHAPLKCHNVWHMTRNLTEFNFTIFLYYRIVFYPTFFNYCELPTYTIKFKPSWMLDLIKLQYQMYLDKPKSWKDL